MASENPKQLNSKRSAPAASTPAPVTPQPVTPPPVPKTPPLFRRVDWLAFAITTLLVLGGYLYTIAPDLTLQDSGELAVASMYAGVPHPPGYPVWTIYTWFFTVIIPFGNMAFRVAVSSAFAGALSCGIITLMVSRGSSMFIESVADLKTIDRKIENWICFVSGFVAGMLFGFNGFMWSQSIIVEVYSLSMLSLTAGVLCLLLWNHAPHKYRYLYFSWFLAGISVNNHQSLFVITIAMEVLIIATQAKLGRVMFLWNGIFYVAGMILYNKGDLSVLGGNTPVMVIFNSIGIGSIFGWIWLSIKTKSNAAEILRDGILIAVSILMVALKGVKGMLVGTSLVLLIYGIIDLALWMQKQPLPWSPHWRKGIGIGVSFVIGLAFYVYMPLASMTNPPLNWGYPRTVGGFIHAFTRGQYEKIHPTAGAGRNIAEQTVSWISTYSKQCWWFLVRGPIEEFNLVYICIGLVPLFFFRRLHARERAWLIGMVAFYFVLGPFLVEMFNPAADRQALELNKPFFIASHVFISLAIGYGLTLLTATLVTHYQRYRTIALTAFGLATAVALYGVWYTFEETPYSVLRATAVFGAVLAAAITACVALPRPTAPAAALLGLFLLLPIHSIVGHWSGTEQRGHYFGYWFGHDMFTPPYKGKDYEKTRQLSYGRKEREELLKTPEGQKRVYPEMTRNTILFGGTDPGRFCPTYMIFCESFTPAKDKPRDPEFDRRDVYIITQNALADATYLQYIRAHYNRSTEPDKPFFSELLRGEKERELNFKTNLFARMFAVPLDNFFLNNGYRIEKARRDRGVYPPVEIRTPSNEESQRSFQEYMNDAQARMAKGQLRPGEDVRVVENRVQVSGQVAVMAINALLCKVIFDNNPTNEFFVEESFPLEWMYPHLTPFGIIMKLNREQLPELTQDIVDKDHLFWSDYSERLIGNWITYDTPISNITQFAERVYVNKNYEGFKGDPRFVRDDDGQKAFSKLRSSIAGVYAWRVAKATERGGAVFAQRPQNTLNPAEKQIAEDYRRMFREAEFAFKQAYAFCPYSPEALYRYVQILAQAQRFDDALLLAKTSKDLDPVNTGLDRLVEELQKMKSGSVGMPPSAAAQSAQQLAQAEAAFRANPNDLNSAAALAQMYASMGRTQDVLRIAETLLSSPQSNPQAVSFAAQIYQQLQDYPNLEKALEKWTKVTPTPEAWLDYAASQAVQNKRAEAVTSLRQALALSAARLKTDPKAENIALSVGKDQRFLALQTFPDFQQLLATNK